jgi:hypothetical protein
MIVENDMAQSNEQSLLGHVVSVLYVMALKFGWAIRYRLRT